VLDPAVLRPDVLNFGTPGAGLLEVATVNQSDKDVVAVTVSRHGVSASDTNVTVTFTGGKSQVESPSQKAFHLVCAGAVMTNTAPDTTTVDLVIPAGSLSKTIAMIIVA
jgi:hypothetical protein